MRARELLHFDHLPHEGAQASLRHDARIEHAQAPRRSVAWIRKPRFTPRRARLVDRLQIAPKDYYLCAQRQWLFVVDTSRQRANRTQVFRDELPGLPVAAC